MGLAPARRFSIRRIFGGRLSKDKHDDDDDDDNDDDVWGNLSEDCLALIWFRPGAALRILDKSHTKG